MARIARSRYPPGYYHLMNRGNARERIFSSAADKNYYKKLARETFEDSSLDLLAWCIMDNHFHFVLKGDPMDFSQALKRINQSYAMAYNRRLDRVGHVFQNRFKGELIDSRDYLLAAVRYLHLNPVKAGMVDNPGDFPWSSFGEYFPNCQGMGPERLESFELYALTRRENRKKILSFFNDSLDDFRIFHGGKDSYMFLDVEEDYKERRAETTVNLLETHFPEYDFEVNYDRRPYISTDADTSDIHLMYMLARILLEKTNMTYTEVADFLGLSRYRVGIIAKNVDREEIMRQEEMSYIN